MNYRYKENSKIDAYGDTDNVIHFKFGDMRKGYNFTKDFMDEHPLFVKEFARYVMYENSLFTDPLSIVRYIQRFNLPIHLYSNFVDEEFADANAAIEWITNEYSGQGKQRDKLYKYDNGKYIGLDNEEEYKENGVL